MSDLRLAGYSEHGGGQDAPPLVKSDARLEEGLREAVTDVLHRNGGSLPLNKLRYGLVALGAILPKALDMSFSDFWRRNGDRFRQEGHTYYGSFGGQPIICLLARTATPAVASAASAWAWPDCSRNLRPVRRLRV